MPDHPSSTSAPRPEADPATPLTSTTSRPAACSSADDDKVICERCNKAEMYRMHAVWRCPECGYKTDCCGW